MLGGVFSNGGIPKEKLSYGFVAEFLLSEYNYNDFDLYTKHGVFCIQGAYNKQHAPSDSPSIVNHGFLMNFAWERSRSCHVFFSAYPELSIFMRRYDGESWGAWVKFTPS